MTMHLHVSRLGDADGVRAAAQLLVDANRTHPTGRLLGSIVITPSDLALDQFAVLVILARLWGRVTLVRDGGQLLGVACWIAHPAGRRISIPARPRPPSEMTATAELTCDAPERVSRLDLLDLALEVPDDSTHLHLACLGTTTGHRSHMIADLLLFEQTRLADRHRHTLYIEAHSDTDRNWLQSLDFHDCGPSSGDPADPQSYVLARTPRPSTSSPHPPAPDPP